MASLPDGGAYAFIDGVVVLVNWSDLEPSPGNFTGSGWNTIDQALGSYNVRLRISAGRNSPDWVKQLGGPARPLDAVVGSVGPLWCDGGGVGVIDPAGSGNGGCVPYFWGATVQSAYYDLLAEVARRYEGNPRLREVVDGMCMTVFDEVFFRQHCEPNSTANLFDAGFNFDADLACQQSALQMLAQLFPTTRTTLSVNTWDEILADGGCRKSPTEAEGLAEWARTDAGLGDRLVVMHNHLSDTDGCYPDGGALDTCFVAGWPGARGFQTQTLTNLGGAPQLESALQNGIDAHANYVELPSGFGAVPYSTLQADDAALRLNP